MDNTDIKFIDRNTTYNLSEDEIVKIINESILFSECRGCLLSLWYYGEQDLMLMSDVQRHQSRSYLSSSLTHTCK